MATLTAKQQDMLDHARYQYGDWLSPEDCPIHHVHISALGIGADYRTLSALERKGLVVSVLDGRYTCTYLTRAGYDAASPNYTPQKDYSHACPKCGGNGYIREYSHVSGGICYACNGKGTRS